jgi:hypothetical protein
MRRQILFIGVLFFVISCRSAKEAYLFTSFNEPATSGLRMLYSYDGYKWTDFDTVFIRPAIGQQKIMRDPSIAKGPDGIYHLVWTTEWTGGNGFGYASSKDLLHWSDQQYIPVMKHEDSVVNVWAPEIFYDDENSQFIIIWASTIPYRFEKGAEEERNNHRMYYTITKDFKTFTDAGLFLDPGFSVIDCVIVKRGKRDYVLVLKDNTRPNRNIKVAFANSPLGPYSKPSGSFTPNFTEGPTVAKVKDDYLIYYDQYRDKIYGAMKTKDFKTFIDITKEISVPKDHKHGTIFLSDKKIVKGLLKYSAKN